MTAQAHDLDGPTLPGLAPCGVELTEDELVDEEEEAIVIRLHPSAIFTEPTELVRDERPTVPPSCPPAASVASLRPKARGMRWNLVGAAVFVATVAGSMSYVWAYFQRL